jgi:excisionase family DNA binding protein
MIDFVSVTEVAQRAGVSRPTAYSWLKTGRVPGLVIKFGRARVERQTFEAWLEKHRSVK